jgi:hypothetical protein
MDAYGAVVLIEWLVHHPVRDVGNRCINLVQRCNLCREEGDDVVVCATAIGAMDAKARVRLFQKLSDLRSEALAAATNAPGLSSKLEDAERALKQARVYEKKKYHAAVQGCKTRLDGAIAKHCKALRKDLQRSRRNQKAWKQYNAQMDKYLEKKMYGEMVALKQPGESESSESESSESESSGSESSESESKKQ